MVKIIFKVLWYIIVITCIILCFYFLFNGGFKELGDLSKDGFFNGVGKFFVNFWEGIKNSFAR